MALPPVSAIGDLSMLFNTTGRHAVAVLGIAMLTSVLSLSGCSDSTTSSTGGSGFGDKKDDPAIKATMKDQMESYKAKAQQKRRR
jgi:hypothetical protein